LDSSRKALEQKFDDARRIDSQTRAWSTAGIVLVVLGMCLLMTFGMMNVERRKFLRPPAAQETGVSEAKNATPKREIGKSIASGSTEAKPKTEHGETSQPSDTVKTTDAIVTDTQHGQSELKQDEKQDSVSRDALFTVIAAEAAGYYRTITTVASAFLGGSLLFLDKLASRPSTLSLFVLGGAWICLIASIACTAWVRRKNLDSGWKALEQRFEDAQGIDKKTRGWSTVGIVSLIFGMCLLMIFGMMNVERCKFLRPPTAQETGVSETEDPTSRREIRKSIAFGSTGAKPKAEHGETSRPSDTVKPTGASVTDTQHGQTEQKQEEKEE